MQRRIRSGSMEEITIRDIARICGVGVSTVSRAINNHPDINPETKEMILSVIKEHGYIPNNSARNLKRTDAKSIAVLVKGITNPFFSGMIKVMEAEIKKKKYSLVLHHVDFNEDEVDVALELIKEKRLRGIIFLGGHFSHSEEKLKKLQVPFILSTVGCPPDNMSRKLYSSISVDDEKESARMVQYLIDQGHRDIAILCAETEDRSIGVLRLEGYKKTLQKNGIPIRDELICSMYCDIESYSMQNGYQVMMDLLKKDVKCTAIFAISDMLAIGAARAILESGRRIPQDYSVSGFDGIDLGSFYTPSITTIRQPTEKLAEATVSLLFEIIAGRKTHQHLVYEGELLERESTCRR
jgi:DNA-binding LacI/PurR family transcriptional regulator